jgi:hypothetical protein
VADGVGKPGWRIIVSFLKVAAFLGTGTMLGLLLGLAFSAHLYGTPPVVIQIQSWIAGDSLREGPLPFDQAGEFDHLRNTAAAVIPKIGACIGFFMAVSIMFCSLILRAVSRSIAKKKGAEGESKVS